MKSTIKSGNLEITTTELGAELLSVKYNGKERLWPTQKAKMQNLMTRTE